jgi:glycosyltransferase involved in cell wall biosynthesis
MEKMVSVIIPAYNESRGIAQVIRIIRSSPLVGEIIVVDDGSSDDTSKRALRAGGRVITLPYNKGKGCAMRIGVAKAKSHTILFCDADMYGFSHESIHTIVFPVLHDEKDMIVGLRPLVSVTRYVLPFLTQLSGFRAIKKSRFLEIPEKFISGAQIELAMNFVGRRNEWRIRYEEVPGLKHSIKEIKYGVLPGLRARTKMFVDMFLFFLDLYLLKRTESNAELWKAKRWET